MTPRYLTLLDQGTEYFNTLTGGGGLYLLRVKIIASVFSELIVILQSAKYWRMSSTYN